MHNLIAEATSGSQLVELAIQYAREDFLTHLAGASVGLLLIIGSLLMLLAAVGLVRLPDLPTRMHASTKAGTLGAALIMLAVAVAIPDASVLARSIAVIAFLLLTAPVAAHVIGRAGYFVGVPLWEGTVKDDLAEQYDYERHTLDSGGLGERDVPDPDGSVSESAVLELEEPVEAADEPAEAEEESEEGGQDEESEEPVEAADEPAEEEEDNDDGGDSDSSDEASETEESEVKKKADQANMSAETV